MVPLMRRGNTKRFEPMGSLVAKHAACAQTQTFELWPDVRNLLEHLPDRMHNQPRRRQSLPAFFHRSEFTVDARPMEPVRH